MPAAHDAWTVLPHQPIEKHSETFWTVTGTMPDGKTQRVMSIAKMKDGRLLIHNGIALEEPLMAEIDKLGTPAAIVVPNGFHRLDSKVFKQRYPQAKLYCPKGATGRVSKVVSVDGDYTAAPADDTVSLTHLAGTKEREGVLKVSGGHGTALVFNDSINNLPKLGFPMSFLLAPTGRVSVPRLARWLTVADAGAFAAQLSELSAIGDLSRVVMSHGAPIASEPGKVLKSLATELAG